MLEHSTTKKQTTKKSKSNEVWAVGVCQYCNKEIMSDQPYDEVFCGRPHQWQADSERSYRKGPVHKRKCKLLLLEQFQAELLNDIETYKWMVESLTRRQDYDRLKKKYDKLTNPSRTPPPTSKKKKGEK